MNLFVITGANGFIGHHLVASLIADGKRVRALTRKHSEGGRENNEVEWIVGDMSDHKTWAKLVEPNCTVINLAYSNKLATSTAVDTAATMIEACAEANISRLIHCSTVSVYGRASETILTEESLCNPLDEYGKVKLRVEQTLIEKTRDRFPVTIIRPSAVFGAGGVALIKLVEALKQGGQVMNYLKSSAFGRRKTHLVPVETVVAALKFLCARPQAVGIEMFIVSDDDNPFNNFRSVERVLMDELKVLPYRVPPIPVPRALLEMLMRFMGRANVNTQTEYRCDKLSECGFIKPVSLENALRQFAGSHRSSPRPGNS